MVYFRLGIAVFASFLACCSRPEPDDVVAVVGSHEITPTALREFVSGLAPGLRTEKTGEAARRHYLQSLVDGRLLLMEARSRGLDTTLTVRESVRNAVATKVRARYRHDKILSRIEVTEDELRAFSAHHGFQIERWFTAIVVDTRADIDKVVGELEAGRPFEEVAREYSTEERAASQGGHYTWVDRYRVGSVGIPLDLFVSLPLGEVSKPQPVDNSWSVLRFTQERPVPFERYRGAARSHLLGDMMSQLEAEHFESLRESFGVRLHPGGLTELREAYRTKETTGLEKSGVVLYGFEGGEVTVAEAYEVMQRPDHFRQLADSAKAVSTLEVAVLRPALFDAAARQAGLYDRPEVREFEEKTAKKALLEMIRKSVAPERVGLSEEQVKQYYDSNPEFFMTEFSAYIKEVLLLTKDEALEVHRRLAAGEPWEDFTISSLREGARESTGRFHFHYRQSALYPRLLSAIMAAPEGEIVGPIEVKGGWSVFKVLSVEPRTVQPYGTAKRQATATLLVEKAKEGMEALLAQLRDKYAAEVRVYESRLAEALPDSLLAD